MNTPAHLIVGMAAFGKPDQTRVTLAALLGALLPDLSLYVLSGVSLFILNIPADVVFGRLYFSDAWQTVFSIDNSFLVWGALLGLGLWMRVPWMIALAGAALLHVALDFPLHHDDGRPHFWPLSDWVFESPVSYWDRDHHGALIGGLEIALCALLAVWLLRRFRTWKMRSLITVLLLAEAAPVFIWVFVFAT